MINYQFLVENERSLLKEVHTQKAKNMARDGPSKSDIESVFHRLRALPTNKVIIRIELLFNFQREIMLYKTKPMRNNINEINDKIDHLFCLRIYFHTFILHLASINL